MQKSNFLWQYQVRKKTTDETNPSCGDEIELAASILIVYDKIITQLLFNTYLVTIYEMLEVESICISWYSYHKATR